MDAVGTAGVRGCKSGPSWERAIKRVSVDFRARMRSWKGRRGEWVVSRTRRGLITFVRKGGA